MKNWKDITTYSKSEINNKIPRTYELRVLGARFHVTREFGYDDAWFLKSIDFNLPVSHICNGCSAKEAIELAEQKIRVRIDQLSNEFKTITGK